MPASTIINKKPAAATDHGGLNLVISMTRTPPGKEIRHACIYLPAAPFKSH